MYRFLLVMAVLAGFIVLTVNAQDEGAAESQPAAGGTGEAVEGAVVAEEGEEKEEEPIVFEEETKNKVSYGIGFNMGSDMVRNFEQSQVRINEDISTEELLKGVADALAKSDAKFDREEVNAAFDKFTQYLAVKGPERLEELSKSNKAAGEKFLADNKIKEGVKTTESGLQYKILEEGEGKAPTPQDIVVVHYTGTFVDGEKFESSRDAGRPATFMLGGVIPGWIEGLQLVKPGGKIKLFIQPELAYGASGSGRMEPNKTLIFEVELLEVRANPQAQPQLRPLPQPQPRPSE